MGKYCIGVDIGGTTVKIGLFTDKGNVKDKWEIVTRKDEGGSFILSEVKNNHLGNYVTLIYPNKDVLMIYENKSCELEYDEYYSAFGDDNHNVYVGSLSLIADT